jgi:hypothetical protein
VVKLTQTTPKILHRKEQSESGGSGFTDRGKCDFPGRGGFGFTGRSESDFTGSCGSGFACRSESLVVGSSRSGLARWEEFGVAGNRGLAFGGTKMVRVDLSWIDTNDQSLNSVIELASDLALYLNLPVVMDLAALKVGREVLHTTHA